LAFREPNADEMRTLGTLVGNGAEAVSEHAYAEWLAQFALPLEYGSPQEAEYQAQTNARECQTALAAIDDRFSSVAGPRASYLNVPEAIVEVLRKGERDNGAMTNAAKLTWAAGIDREEGETWEQAERRVLGRFRRALKGHDTKSRAGRAHARFWIERQVERLARRSDEKAIDADGR
jgi:hypothetical protein